MTSETYEQILTFSIEMEKKLAQNRHKGNRRSWLYLRFSQLLKLLKDEVTELEEELSNQNEDQIISECADIANFAMMIADKAKEKKTTEEKWMGEKTPDKWKEWLNKARTG